MRTVITAAHLLTPEMAIERPVVVMQDGVLISIQSADIAEVPTATQHIDHADATLVPAFFDVHTHGGKGHDVMEATADAIDTLGAFLTTRGVGAYFPTTVTAPVDSILRALDGLARQIERTDHPGAAPLGVHMEGPFLSCEKRGVHPPELLLPPSVPLFDRFYEAARGHIALMTLAPELPGAPELIEHATRKGVRISLGHSDAHTDKALAGIAAGACSATHTYNAMRALNHRDPGILGVVLDQQSLFAEIICDAIHVDPALVRLYWKAKGPDRCILITDAISATGMPDGTYRLGNFDVTVANGTCLSEGRLAGSVLTLDRALKNFVAFTGCGLQAGLRCLTTNPARMTGLEGRVGALTPGRLADITVLSPQGEVRAMLLRGKQVFPAR